MGENSKIEWTDATWNPWQGCTKLSPACANCYMFRDMKRYGRDGSFVHKSSDATWDLPIKRWAKGEKAGQYKIPPGSKVFTCSWSDWFHEAADVWREQAWDIIRQRPDLTFQIVTKRTDRILSHLPPDWGDGWANVWIIATVENQEWADKRIPELLQVPSIVRGISIEPLLGPIDLRQYLKMSRNFHLAISVTGAIRNRSFEGYTSADGRPYTPEQVEYLLRDFESQGVKVIPADKPCDGFDFQTGCPGHDNPRIDWVIVGGESGPSRREMPLDAIESLADQCEAAGVPFYCKQDSGPRSGERGRLSDRLWAMKQFPKAEVTA